jgi:hypothetical protein
MPLEVFANDRIVRAFDDRDHSLPRIQGLNRLISRRREHSQIGHYTQVFRVEPTALIMGDDPDRTHGLAIDVKGN